MFKHLFECECASLCVCNRMHFDLLSVISHFISSFFQVEILFDSRFLLSTQLFHSLSISLFERIQLAGAEIAQTCVHGKQAIPWSQWQTYTHPHQSYKMNCAHSVIAFTSVGVWIFPDCPFLPHRHLCDF